MDVDEYTTNYTVTFHVATRYINSEVRESYSLWDEYGYTDQEWDAMEQMERDNLFDEWSHEWAMQEIEYWGEVS
jgi:hypothetical protein